MKTINTYYHDYETLQDFVQSNCQTLFTEHKRSILAQVFAGRCDKNLLITVSREIRELVPGAQVIGVTTNGEIMDGEISGLKTVISFSVFRDIEVKAAVLMKDNLSDFDLGRSLAGRLNHDKAQILLLFSTSHTVNASQLLNGVQAFNSDLPVAGGNAGDNFMNQKTLVLANDICTDSGAAGAVLIGQDLIVTQLSHLGWQPIGKEMTITRSKGQRVYTIDDLPAYRVYQHYLGASKYFDILDGLEFPLVIQKHGLLIARIPYRRFSDDSLEFFGDIDQGEKVRISFGHISMISDKINDLLRSIQETPVESIFVYSCGARRSLLDGRADMETLPLQQIAPTAGFFTAGEFFHANKNNQFLNHTMTIVALSETPDTAGSPKTLEYFKREIEPSQDNVAHRNVSIIKALTGLISNVTDELNKRSQDLESQRHDFINHLQTLYGLIVLGEVQQAMNYINELHQEMKSE